MGVNKSERLRDESSEDMDNLCKGNKHRSSAEGWMRIPREKVRLCVVVEAPLGNDHPGQSHYGFAVPLTRINKSSAAQQRARTFSAGHDLLAFVAHVPPQFPPLTVYKHKITSPRHAFTPFLDTIPHSSLNRYSSTDPLPVANIYQTTPSA
ncbi:unnamed protein product [Toxocara canis]|uniref:Uncharacterized protein n=1 Tax=Toxocara canis TaxID=6265 RepID=A0A183UMK4_TOXCA|nr:unnamed protein product [Toxocara canis]